MPRARALGDRDLTRLVATAYEAALTPALWPVFAEDLTKTFGAAAFNLPVFAPELGAGGCAVAWGLPDEFGQAYSTHYWSHDLWRVAAHRKRVPVLRGVVGEALVPEAELVNGVMYNDLFRRGDFRHMGGGYLFHRPTDGAGAALSLLRTARQGAFSASELRQIERLLPHVARAIALWLRVAAAEARAGALTADVENAGDATLLVDGGGRVIDANGAAERVLQADSALRLRDGRLRADGAKADQALQRLLRRALDVAAPAAEVADLAITRPPPLPPLRVRALPLRESLHPLAPLMPALLVLIDDPSAMVPAPAARVAGTYGLTAAEAALLAALADGASIGEHAERRGISIHTARNQLKSVFQKTGTRRQSDLVRLVWRDAS